MARDKHVLPAALPTADEADYTRLVPPEGPWTAPQWSVVPGVGNPRRGLTGMCSATGCTGDASRKLDGATLCYPHEWQWLRAGKPAVLDWLPKARPPQKRRRSNGVSTRVIDFCAMPRRVASEIRYVAGTKIEKGEWTPNTTLLRWLELLIQAVTIEDVDSLLDRRPEDWALLVRQSTTTSFANTIADSYARTFFATLHRALLIDPWAEDVWLWKGCFDALVHRNATTHNGTNIHWGRISQPWLRDPVKAWARQCLSTGTRAWATVIDWSAGLYRFSQFLEAEGIDEPALLDRSVFLDYLVQLNETNASNHALSSVNQVAAVLAAVQQEVPDTRFGSEVFLRYGENVVPKVRAPRPYPEDVVHRVDTLVLVDPEIEDSARLMLQLTRWGGLRISELVNLPNDCLRVNSSGGHWVEYYMHKTRRFRAFPIPQDLGQALVTWRRSITREFGPDTGFMFPSPKRSSAAAQRVVPWSASGFRNHIAASFARNGITDSGLTGEAITGGEIHRYRHTIGTALLNNGWTQQEVQEFLGHDSPTMTSNYAAINDDTLARKIQDFRDSTRESRGDAPDPGVEHLRGLFAYALPDGYCQLPANMPCETRDNPCSNCSFFDGRTEDVRPVHQSRQKRLKVLIESTNDPKVRDLNQRALNDVERLLTENEDTDDAEE